MSETINQEAIYCDGDGEYRVLRNISDRLSMERFYIKNLKSSTHSTKFRKSQQLNNNKGT